MKYSIHRCLAELKLLDSRISKATKETFIGYKKNSATGEYETHKSEEEFKTCVSSNYDSVISLINRRKEIKEAIVNSNAITKVVIAGVEYTVASAIERKNSISYEKTLLNNLNYQYLEALRTVNNNNDRMELNLDKQVTQMIGSDNNKQDDVTKFSQFYREQNGYTVLDPIGLKGVIDKMSKEISDFVTEVDCVLSESNAITQVEILS